jgi:23S rRNA (adenine2503-C2)-methyltransferase
MTPGLPGLALGELMALLGSRTAALAAKRWLHQASPPTALPSHLPGVSRAAVARLCEVAPLPVWRLHSRSLSSDGTLKLVIGFEDALVETVLIPGRSRSTVCLSSQAGCSRRCTFCATAGLGFNRSLSSSEIVLQYIVARSFARPESPARNVVFMGMGEPMDNLDEVMRAITHLTEPPFPALSEGHVTVSTSGIVPGMRRFLREGRGCLALSLNATSDALRQRLMPHTAQWPISSLLGVLREEAGGRKRRRYFIEYVLWNSVNDGDEDARRLAALLEGLPAHVNLIPHNSFPGADFSPPPPERVARFQCVVRQGGVPCFVRRQKGHDIAAACGQLSLQAPSTPRP